MDPESLLRFHPGWDHWFLGVGVVFFSSLLLLLPLAWMTAIRAMDVVGLTLAHQGLILLGYFFIDRTAANLGIAELAAIQEGLPWVVLINLTGFAILLPVLGFSYFWEWRQGYRLKPLPAPREEMDRRLLPFLRVMAVLLCGLIVLPMLMTGAVPMISGGAGRICGIKCSPQPLQGHCTTSRRGWFLWWQEPWPFLSCGVGVIFPCMI